MSADALAEQEPTLFAPPGLPVVEQVPRAYDPHRVWVRTDQNNGAQSLITELEVFAKLNNAQAYDDVKAAMATATKTNPLGTGYATYHPRQ